MPEGPALGISGVALGEGASAEVEIDLAPIACTSQLRCRDAFLADPITGVRGPTLITRYACSFLGGEAPWPGDTLLAMERRLVCFDAGDPAHAETFSPPGGHVVTPFEESYAGITTPFGDAHLDSATLLTPLSGFSFCRYEAWGLLHQGPRVGATAEAELIMEGPVARWSTVITPDGAGGFDCGLSPGGPGASRLGYATAVAVGPIAPTGSEPLPVRFESAILVEIELLTGSPANVNGTIHGLEVLTSRGMAFPVDVRTEIPGFERRLIWVVDPATDQPGDLRLVSGCAAGRDGALAAIALGLEERWSRDPLGVVVLTPDAGGGFDCERDAADGPCALVAVEDARVVAPCLAEIGLP